ncbi:FCD domain-containing protein [Cellulomonas hominis]|jgi:DNA-binding FadR family transcriptional regulator|uniref:DNA-binding FadR family transcriptional regulator n=1 Tax=Cellulomonas hominis TaxID=156981 RepID=A0A511FIR1_9CELL|nr:FCD domain-containing protein [Cellulomonas hominis]MBB5471763.1 DNA-binding FadR family transcriptional regulator [Cellulomonas hominis]MBU5424755.1 FCD domain-containing protein [Cellulomonas hominis]NKY07163.1 FadR family transcriptional regulator [Cellulomonas hominis]NKY11589.1 FadR family transcriptional regulator [Cellulomonas hominis]GEL48454.1 GntR family transcriptional regulator [Cellulomonas hominis]
MTRRTGLIDATVAQLRARITSGDWPVGTRIPPEPALVELLGVGRNTVREAVQSLVHAGLVERRQGSGTYVLSTSELAVSMGRQIADARQRDVIEVRRSLEVEAARLAARRRTTADVAAITTLRDERAEAYRSGQLDRMVAADLALHRAIARAARNPVLLSLYENLIDAVTDNIRFNFAHLQDGDNHDGLVDAIAAGDDARAVEETATYLSGLLGED